MMLSLNERILIVHMFQILWEITPTNNIFRHIYIHNTMSETISVFLSTPQKNKLQSGKTFQLSASALQAGSGKHNVDIEMSTKDYKQLVKNVGNNKGYRFTADKVMGSGFFKDIGKVIAKKVVPKILDKIGEKTGKKGLTDALKGSVDGLVDVGADRISGGKLVKGSQAMKDHMAKLRNMRKGKGVKSEEEIEGSGILDDIKNGWNRTFNPKLGRKIKKAFTSKPAREVYKGLANVGLKIGSSFTGLPLGLAEGEIDRQIDEASVGGKRYAKKNTMIQGGTLVKGVPYPQIRHGGIMKKVSGKVSGKGFTSKNGTHYGGSFASPVSGGSFASA
jgi:hypothetical protein